MIHIRKYKIDYIQLYQLFPKHTYSYRHFIQLPGGDIFVVATTSTASRAQDFVQLMGNCKCGFSTPETRRFAWPWGSGCDGRWFGDIFVV